MVAIGTGTAEEPVAAVSALGFDKLRLHIPARPGDELSLRSKVLECRASRSRPDVAIVRCSRELLNQRGEIVFSDESAALIQCRPGAGGP